MKLLYLTHRLPYAPNRGDRIRAHYTLSVLRSRAEVDLVSLVHDRDERAHQGDLRSLVNSVSVAPVPQLRNRVAGAFALAGSRPLTHSLLDSPAIRPLLNRLVRTRRPDVVLAYCSGMARFALEPPLAGLPLVIDLVDVDSCKWNELASTAAAPMKWIYRREAQSLSDFEAHMARAAFATVVVNDRERKALASIAPDARIDVVPSGVAVEEWQPHDAAPESNDVVFCGVMNYAPNEEAAIWLAREVWPLVLKTNPSARLKLVGSHPTRHVKALAAADSTVEVTGHVLDVRPFLWRGAVAAAPLRIARGIQNKVLEAVAAGLPTVVTPVVAEGLPAEILRACAVANDATAFASALVRFLAMTPRERRISVATADLGKLSWNARLAPLVELLEDAAFQRRP
jgi:sugar transferase (PEP-CTERM/EpsH1 system associated)